MNFLRLRESPELLNNRQLKPFAQQEDECRQSLDPKYAHLTDDLHVEITALAPPAEAHARIAFALAEVRKYLIPDNNDNIRQEQMREMELSIVDEPGTPEERRPSIRSPGILRPTSRPVPPPPRSSRPPSSRLGINISKFYYYR